MTAPLLIVASKLGYQTRKFVEAADHLGLPPVLVTDRCHRLEDPWQDRAIPFREAEQIDRGCGILAVGDRPTPVAAALAGRLGLPFHPVAAVESARNKFLAREKLRLAGLPVPAFFRVSASSSALDAASRASFPCVLKPLGLSGSRGVIRADSTREFVDAFARIRNILAQPDIRQLRDAADDFIQVEDYIPGAEYALEGVMTGGLLRTLAIFDKPDPLVGPFFEETIYITPTRSVHSVRIEDAVQQAATALGLTDGPIHAELRIAQETAWVLEVAGRPIGGLCSQTLRFQGGVSLEEILIRHAIGERIGPLCLEGPAAGVMMIPIPQSGVYQSVEGVSDAAKVPWIEDVVITAKPGQALLAIPEGSSYLGFLFSRAATPDLAEHALRQAHGCLRFDLAHSLPVLPKHRPG